ncbi:MAG: hypothetical protein ACOCSL_05720 [Thermoplasmatota archaeon]
MTAMGISKEKYEELLEKEKNKRKSRMKKYQFGVFIVAILIGIAFFIDIDWTYRIILIIVIGFHGSVLTYYIIKNLSLYYSLTDELKIEGDHITKYNPDQDKYKIWIKIDDIENIYMNIEKRPNTFYIVYEEDGDRRAEGFYKERIPEKERFFDLMEERNLVIEKRITYPELKDIVSFGEIKED